MLSECLSTAGRAKGKAQSAKRRTRGHGDHYAGCLITSIRSFTTDKTSPCLRVSLSPRPSFSRRRVWRGREVDPVSDKPRRALTGYSGEFRGLWRFSKGVVGFVAGPFGCTTSRTLRQPLPGECARLTFGQLVLPASLAIFFESLFLSESARAQGHNRGTATAHKSLPVSSL